MLYFKADYELIVPFYIPELDEIHFECVYYLNGVRKVDIWEHAPADMEITLNCNSEIESRREIQ